MIIWNGVSSESVDVIVQHHPARILPKRKIEKVSVPGRNGDLIFSQDAFENVEQEYDIAISANTLDLMSTSIRVGQWLLSPKGYCELEDSYDPEIYRMAYYSGSSDIVNILNLAGTANITFDCKPQRFLKAYKNRWVTFNEETNEYINPTKFISLPLIRILGSGRCDANVGGYDISVSNVNGYVDIDCELMDCFCGNINMNGNTTLGSLDAFPKLQAGKNNVSFSRGTTAIKIQPRWWIL